MDMNRKKQSERLKQMELKKHKLFVRKITVSIISVMLVLIGVAVYVHVSIFNRRESAPLITSPSLSWGSFTKVSDYSSSGIKIYYISWYGCPIGAVDSWEFYNALSHYGNISNYVETHYSDPNDLYPNTPGLIFTRSFTLGDISFDPVYVYNQYLNATISGLPIPANDLLHQGMLEINSTLPSGIASIEYKVMYSIPTSYFGKPSGIENGHINTNIIIVRDNGTWVLNGPLFNPLDLAGISPTQLLHNLQSNIHIAEESISVSKVIDSG
jgi:hypothetical protein